MCLIIVKKKGVELPKDEWLETGEKNNPHGIGVGYLKDGKSELRIKKDFYNSISLIKWMEKNITIDDTLVIHFRLATHGLKDIGNRHPFPLTKDKSLLRKPNLICQYLMVHNGIISQFDAHPKFSDTQKFVLGILGDEEIKSNLDNPSVKLLIKNFIDNDKLAILKFDGTLYLFGEFIKEEGLLFSNGGYRPIVYSYQSNWNWYNTKEKNEGWVNRCEGCAKKDLVRYFEYQNKNGTTFSGMLCKKCRKKMRKEKLILKNKEIENKSDEIICDSCLNWFDKKEITQTNWNGNLCKQCQ